MARSLDSWLGDSTSGDNNKSAIARLGGFGQQYTDPLYWIFGDKYTDKLIGYADKSNKFLSKAVFKPVGKYAGQFDPIRQNSKTADDIGDWGESKPLDTAALLAGGYFAGAGLGGAAGGGGGGAAGGSAAGGGAGAGGAGLGAAGTTAGFMPGSAAGGAAGMEGVTVLGSAGGAAMTPGTAAAMAAAGAGGASAAQGQGNDWRDWMDRAQQLQGNSGGQQQQGGGMPPQGASPGRKPTMMEKVRSGLGRVGESMFPIDQAYGMSPAQQQAARKSALLQMGLGMMAASGGGAGFGEAAAFGLGKAQNNLTGALQRGYENARETRQEQRQKERDETSDSRWATEMDYRQEQDRIQNEQQQHAYDRAIGNDQRSESWARLKYEQDQGQFDQAMRLREQTAAREAALMGAGAVPSGYRRTKDGNLEPVKGGPADPQNKTGNYQEAERTAAFLGTRVADGLRTLQSISTEDQTPGLAEKGLLAMGQDTLANGVRGEARQRANAAQRDVLDAGLTLATGAAYTKEQIEAMRESYFPQIGDTDAVKTDKAQRLQMLLDAARVKAGRAGEQIDKVLGKSQQVPAWGADIQSLLDMYDPPK